MDVIVRDATEEDQPSINDIYNNEVLHGVATFDVDPWPLEQRREWFRLTQNPYAVIVAEADDAVVAFGCLRPFRPKAAYRFTAEDSVYVHPDHQRKGIGGIILPRLVETARANGFRTIIAGIVRDNPASERLHRRHGFALVGTEHEVGYKFERWLDVSWYQLMLT